MAALSVACQADISGGSQSPDGPGPGQGPNNEPPVQVPEPGDWFGAVEQAECNGAFASTRTRIRRLGNVQWKNTVTQAIGANVEALELPDDAISSATGFNTDADLNKVNVLLANAYFDAGESLAPAVATALMGTYTCLTTAAADAACSAPAVKDLGNRLFRRPLTDEESTRYSAFLAAQAALDPPDVAVASLVRAFLLSPNMIYITELGGSIAGDNALTGYEQASLISYLVADVPPDAELMQAAAGGALNDAAQRVAHAERLLQTPSARAKYADFWRQYLPLGDLRQADGVDATLSAAIADETQQHWEKIVWQQNGSFADLVTAPYTYGQQSLSAVYGTLTPNGMGALSLPAGQRSGFLTQSAFLFVSESATPEHKIIHRGLTVRKRLLCQTPPPPPANLMPAAADLRPLGEGATPVESYEAFKASKPACAACHNSFQPIGLAFEEYDNLGKYRTTYADGKDIVTTGELSDAGDASGAYTNAVEIAQRIGQSKIGEYCFTRQYADYALGRHLNAAVDACVIRAPSATNARPPVQKLAVVLSDIAAGSRRFHN